MQGQELFISKYGKCVLFSGNSALLINMSVMSNNNPHTHHPSLFFLGSTLTLDAFGAVVIFRVNPRFHTMLVIWNLEWTWEIQDPASEQDIFQSRTTMHREWNFSVSQLHKILLCHSDEDIFPYFILLLIILNRNSMSFMTTSIFHFYFAQKRNYIN